MDEVYVESVHSAENLGEREFFLNRSISMGFPSQADDYLERPLNLNDYVTHHPEATYFFRMRGESMLDRGIRDRDILVVDRVEDPQPGQIVVAAVNGEMSVKRLLAKGGKWLLEPYNCRSPAEEITEELDYAIWGVVTHVLHTFVP